MSSISRIPVGISECLLGMPVRHNGGHKLSRYCTDMLSRYFDYVAVCPEVASGLPVPRPAIRLVATDAGIRVQGSKQASWDVTEQIHDASARILASLPPLSGFIVMQNSPTCGMERVKLYSAAGIPDGQTSGVFAAALMAAQPLLPVEEAGRLSDATLRENFVLRVFAYHDWRETIAGGLTAHTLIQFYSRYKYLVMAHHVESYRQIGRLLANAGKQDIATLADTFARLFMGALARRATRASHVNVLQHIKGYLKQQLSGSEKQELDELLEEYRTGTVPLVVPMTLIMHHFRQHPDGYISQQAYLQPHPRELGLRNDI